MRGKLALLAAFGALLASSLGVSACGDDGSEGRQYGIEVARLADPDLRSRTVDMRDAALLALKQTNFDTAKGRLTLAATSPGGSAIARINALGPDRPVGNRRLSVSMRMPSASAPDPSRSIIWLLPSAQDEKAAILDFTASGLARGRLSGDDPLVPGTPAGTYVTPALSPDAYPPAGRRFSKAFADEYGRDPDRYAIFAYEAAGLIIDAIQRLEAQDKPVTRDSVREEAFKIKDRYGPVGHYDVRPNGRTTLYLFEARGSDAPPLPASLIEVNR